jgi:hypothetical protein
MTKRVPESLVIGQVLIIAAIIAETFRITRAFKRVSRWSAFQER